MLSTPLRWAPSLASAPRIILFVEDTRATSRSYQRHWRRQRRLFARTRERYLPHAEPQRKRDLLHGHRRRPAGVCPEAGNALCPRAWGRSALRKDTRPRCVAERCRLRHQYGLPTRPPPRATHARAHRAPWLLLRRGRPRRLLRAQAHDGRRTRYGAHLSWRLAHSVGKSGLRWLHSDDPRDRSEDLWPLPRPLWISRDLPCSRPRS